MVGAVLRGCMETSWILWAVGAVGVLDGGEEGMSAWVWWEPCCGW